MLPPRFRMLLLSLGQAVSNMSKLSSRERDSLPASAFVFPDERSFPIPDRAHAYEALRMAGKEAPDKASAVRSEVCKRFSIGCSGAEVSTGQ